MGESAQASLGSLSKYGRFFCLHLSHAGHGPRDLLSRYCEQDFTSPAGPSAPSWLPQHLPNLLSQSSPPAGSPTPPSHAPAPTEESLSPQIPETHIPPAAWTQPVSAGESFTNIYRATAARQLLELGPRTVDPVDGAATSFAHHGNGSS